MNLKNSIKKFLDISLEDKEAEKTIQEKPKPNLSPEAEPSHSKKINNSFSSSDYKPVAQAKNTERQTNDSTGESTVSLLPDFDAIPKGELGYKSLVQSQELKDVDRQIAEVSNEFKIKGTPLISQMTQKSAEERTQSYKKESLMTYDEAVTATKEIFLKVSEKKMPSFNQVKGLVNAFFNSLCCDRDLLLNFAHKEKNFEDYLYNHAVNVSIISMNIGAALGYDQKQTEEVGLAGLLSDIGMMLLPNELRLKKGRFNQEEKYEMQKHPIFGYHILKRITGLPETVSFAAYQHHERNSGAGYPKQRKARFIHPYAKVVTIADIYESLNSERPHRKAMVPYKALETLAKMAKLELVDPLPMRGLLRFLGLYPVGSLVRLSDQCVARVIQPNPSDWTRPRIAVLIDSEGDRIPYDEIKRHDLIKEKEISIIGPADHGKIEIGILEGF